MAERIPDVILTTAPLSSARTVTERVRLIDSLPPSDQPVTLPDSWTCMLLLGVMARRLLRCFEITVGPLPCGAKDV